MLRISWQMDENLVCQGSDRDNFRGNGIVAGVTGGIARHTCSAWWTDIATTLHQLVQKAYGLEPKLRVL